MVVFSIEYQLIGMKLEGAHVMLLSVLVMTLEC